MLRHGIAIGDERIGCRFVAERGAWRRVPLRPLAQSKEQSDRRLTMRAWLPRVRDCSTTSRVAVTVELGVDA